MLNAGFKIGSLRGNRQTGLGYGLWTIDYGLSKTTNS